MCLICIYQRLFSFTVLGNDEAREEIIYLTRIIAMIVHYINMWMKYHVKQNI